MCVYVLVDVLKCVLGTVAIIRDIMCTIIMPYYIVYTFNVYNYLYSH